MKGMDILCASEGATAICLGMMEHPSSSSSPSSNLLLGGGGSSPAIDRHNPIIRHTRRSTTAADNKRLPPKENKKSWSCTKPTDYISPPGSTRYLLNALSHLDTPSLHQPPQISDEPPSSSAAVDRVVVLRVSLHCRGCERKMRKHISRMEGVRSFDIDFAAKKVTVSGNVTPLEVLSSISKVKNAQLWGPTADKGNLVGVGVGVGVAS